MLRTTALILTAGLLSACMFEPEPYAVAPTATSVPTSVMLPPIAPNLVTPPNPFSLSPIPQTRLPPAPPEIIAPAGADEVGPLEPR